MYNLQADILRPTLVRTEDGGGTTTLSAVVTGVPCRISRNREARAIPGEVMASTVSSLRAYLPPGTSISETDVLKVGTSEYDVDYIYPAYGASTVHHLEVDISPRQ